MSDNVAFGLRYQKVSRGERGRRVRRRSSWSSWGSSTSAGRTSSPGGQQQRVALARALILRPRVLLLDEPLGALDAKIRRQLRLELKSLQEEVGTTFMFVTHDQEEALSMSDRIAVMNRGQIDQMGTPREVYEAPAPCSSPTSSGVSNLLSGNATGNGTFRVGEFTLRCEQGATSATGVVHAVIRPERVLIGEQGLNGDNTLPGLIDRVVFVGSVLDVRVRLASGELVRSLVANDGSGRVPTVQGTPVSVHLPPDAVRILQET